MSCGSEVRGDECKLTGHKRHAVAREGDGGMRWVLTGGDGYFCCCHFHPKEAKANTKAVFVRLGDDSGPGTV